MFLALGPVGIPRISAHRGADAAVLEGRFSGQNDPAHPQTRDDGYLIFSADHGAHARTFGSETLRLMPFAIIEFVVAPDKAPGARCTWFWNRSTPEERKP
jgi:hypothetical protein